ncbi:hypothetical protein NOF55_02920 [Rhizobiaceae bacterium BDR2-2]|uniref:Uncharacterized protein n=1 Tax=Ectorhizobium quercum TaxID=2965071 RepID=A0AAE3MZJ7_9HYPH|nr:hypothetical protein [Ectorhizobium quercum]MCX8996047.1 hypothetical protein [Ectorhizobium quercum]
MATLIRSLAVATVMAMLALPAMAQSATAPDRLGIPGPITFDDKAFVLSWSSQPSTTYFKQEYLPAGQTGNTYTEMFLVEALLGNVRPIDSAGAQVKMIQQRQQTDKVANFSILQNEQTGEVLLDFVLSDLQANPIIVEWNAYRYVPLEGAEGVALYAISRRGYGEDGAKALLQGLGAIRDSHMQELGSSDLPPVKVAP